MPQLLKDFYNACDPLKPASPAQYIDSDPARGSRDFVVQFQNELEKIEGGFLCYLFSGHTGCGKSSELRHLSEKLRHPDPRVDHRCYFPIVLDADEYLDDNDVTPTDILLAIVAQVAQSFKELGIDLQDSYLHKRLAGLKDLLFSEVEIPELAATAGTPKDLPFVASITAKFKLLKRDPTSREKVRRALENHISPLRLGIKDQFEEARAELRKQEVNGCCYTDFVLILDNLEKMQRIRGFDDGYRSHRELFVERATQLTGLGAHIVYTVPLPLVLTNGAELLARYGSTPFVLPMIKVEYRGQGHQEYPCGIKTLRDLVEKRHGGDTTLDDIIETKALEFLIRYSGGHTRQLMMFLRQATTVIETAPITLEAAKRSLADTVAMYSRMPEAYWAKLAALELSENQIIDTADADIKQMLNQLMILEYRNGGTEEDPFNPSAAWYAVHPIIRELNPFKSAVARLRQASEKERSGAA